MHLKKVIYFNFIKHIQYKLKFTLLFYFHILGDLNKVIELIHGGINPYIKNSEEKTPLYLAIDHRNI